MNLSAILAAVLSLVWLATISCNFAAHRITVESTARNLPAMKYDPTKPRGKRYH